MVDLLLKRKGIEIKEAKTKEELEQVYHLRWEVYGGEGYIDPSKYPDQKLHDKYDSHSTIFLAIKKRKLIGTIRVVHCSEMGFPTENAFNILDFPFSREEAVEISKLCATKRFRGGIVSLGLLEKALEYSKKQNVKYWLLGTSPKLLKYFEMWCRMIPKLLPTGPPRLEHLKERITAERYFQKVRLLPYVLEIGKIE